MEQNPDKKPIKGQEFLQRVGRNLLGSKNNPSPEDQTAEFKRKTEAAKAQHDYVVTVDSLANPPSIQELRAKAEQAEREARQAAETRANAAEQRERERAEEALKAAEQKATEASQALQQAEQQLRDQQIQTLINKLDELKGSQKPLSQQLTEYLTFAEELATKLGFQKPGTATAVASSGQDAHITLEIEKLRLEDARANREFQWKMEEAKRNWDLKVIEINDGREFKKQELAQQARRDEHLFSFPQILGGAIAKGLMEREQGGATPPRSISQRQPGGTQTHEIQAGQGEFGEFECPNCHTPVGIGPTTTLAECVQCHTQYPVVRTSATENPEPAPP